MYVPLYIYPGDLWLPDIELYNTKVAYDYYVTPPTLSMVSPSVGQLVTFRFPFCRCLWTLTEIIGLEPKLTRFTQYIF